MTWDILAVGDGCPNDSIGVARKIGWAKGLRQCEAHQLARGHRPAGPVRRLRSQVEEHAREQEGKCLFIRFVLGGQERNPREAWGRWSPLFHSDLLIDMSQCGLLPAGIMSDGCFMSMAAKHGTQGTFLWVTPRATMTNPT